jgi:hypothetical protein
MVEVMFHSSFHAELKIYVTNEKTVVLFEDEII